MSTISWGTIASVSQEFDWKKNDTGGFWRHINTLGGFNATETRLLIYAYISCQNFWDETWWFLPLRVFGTLSSSLLIFPQHFGRYVLRPLSNSGTFTELRTTSFIETTGVACSDSVCHNVVQVFRYSYSPAIRIEP